MARRNRRPAGKSGPRLRARLRWAMARIAEMAQGLGRPARGGCCGDPVAWEFDHQQRAAERVGLHRSKCR